MPFSVFMYVMMSAPCVALGGVLVFDAANAVLRRLSHRAARPVVSAHRRAATSSGAR